MPFSGNVNIREIVNLWLISWKLLLYFFIHSKVYYFFVIWIKYVTILENRVAKQGGPARNSQQKMWGEFSFVTHQLT